MNAQSDINKINMKIGEGASIVFSMMVWTPHHLFPFEIQQMTKTIQRRHSAVRRATLSLDRETALAIAHIQADIAKVTKRKPSIALIMKAGVQYLAKAIEGTDADLSGAIGLDLTYRVLSNGKITRAMMLEWGSRAART